MSVTAEVNVNMCALLGMMKVVVTLSTGEVRESVPFKYTRTRMAWLAGMGERHTIVEWKVVAV